MKENTVEIIRRKALPGHMDRLLAINNPEVVSFVAEYVDLCDPESVFVFNGSKEDEAFIRDAAISLGEEKPLGMKGHTIHFDGYNDQARDKKNTRILLPPGIRLNPTIDTMDRETGLKEIREIMRGIMKGKMMYVCFYNLGPKRSEFSIQCVQLTDSSYVAHSENLLYRPAYDEFLRLGPKARFFRFVHSAGELVNGVSKNIDKRRVYIDPIGEIVYSANTQYGGNTIGLKKLAMRLAIWKGSKEGWLTEHMLIMGVNGPNGRVTYFTGAFPSLCGKTSTSMMVGERIVGDDIAYLHKRDGEVRAVNVERGVFGIIQGINSKDDPIQWKALHSPNEIIFSNVLVYDDGKVYWIGKDGETPSRGINHSGEWYPGKKDANGKLIDPSHKNARFTLRLDCLENLDPRLEDPAGVPVRGIIYGGRDSDTCVPVEQAFDWVHGIITKGAILESETTAATLGQEGVREVNPMSNLDFLSIPLARYIMDNINFGKDLKTPPLIFGVNYFLRDKNGKFLNEKNDKGIWLKWMELRVHGEAGALRTPTGLIPEYSDLKRLFKVVQNKEYTEDMYTRQFTVRIPEWLAKIERVTNYYRKNEPDTPPIFYEIIEQQKKRLLDSRERFGDYIAPEKLPEE